MKTKLQPTVLDDLCEQIVDSEHKTAPTQSFGIPYVRTPNVKHTQLILDNEDRLVDNEYKNMTIDIANKGLDIILTEKQRNVLNNCYMYTHKDFKGNEEI